MYIELCCHVLCFRHTGTLWFTHVQCIVRLGALLVAHMCMSMCAHVCRSFPWCIVVFTHVHIPVRSSTGHRTPMYNSVYSLSCSSVLRVHVTVQFVAGLCSRRYMSGCWYVHFLCTRVFHLSCALWVFTMHTGSCLGAFWQLAIEQTFPGLLLLFPCQGPLMCLARSPLSLSGFSCSYSCAFEFRAPFIHVHFCVQSYS